MKISKYFGFRVIFWQKNGKKQKYLLKFQIYWSLKKYISQKSIKNSKNFKNILKNRIIFVLCLRLRNIHKCHIFNFNISNIFWNELDFLTCQQTGFAYSLKSGRSFLMIILQSFFMVARLTNHILKVLDVSSPKTKFGF